jgi:hypothetical protein
MLGDVNRKPGSLTEKASSANERLQKSGDPSMHPAAPAAADFKKCLRSIIVLRSNVIPAALQNHSGESHSKQDDAPHFTVSLSRS